MRSANNEILGKLKTYLGSQLIGAAPFAYSQFCDVAGLDVPDKDGPGFLLRKPDDSVSWLSTEAFQAMYRSVESLTFGLATEALKKGFRVTRLGWDSPEEYLFFVPTSEKMGAFVALRQGDKVTPYIPNTVDWMADDWAIVRNQPGE